MHDDEFRDEETSEEENDSPVGETDDDGEVVEPETSENPLDHGFTTDEESM